ncbi:unnamed protein product [Spirodela intermedia]|uniref:Uncharacterized protein n=1 Tax=Spirodela intermedia TaxID=51605 RepID=A0A7I8LJT2_SPIIN|nr:unnamed protein product [Spirodela intermedia]
MKLVAPCALFGDSWSSLFKLHGGFSATVGDGGRRGYGGGGHRRKLFTATSRRRMTVFAGYAGGRQASVTRASSRGRMFSRLDSCLVVPPPSGRKPLAVIMFLGGAFVGAVPEVTYSYLLELLAEEGFLLVSVPYNVTFDHSRAAREVYERFNGCMEKLSASGVPDSELSAADLTDLPLYSVGHSNGALLQLMVGSYFSEKIPKANAIISFNNKPASVAVPYFEQLGPLVSQTIPVVEASPLYSLATSASGDAWKAFLDTTSTFLKGYDQEAAVSLNKFVDQLPSVINEVTQGASEFKPTPSENRDLFSKSYNVPHTLLVKFNADTIDETDTLEQVLRSRVESTGGTLEKVSLSGNHLTPCVQDIRWEVGSRYTPADAIAQGLKSLSLKDTRVLATTVAHWLDQKKGR